MTPGFAVSEAVTVPLFVVPEFCPPVFPVPPPVLFPVLFPGREPGGVFGPGGVVGGGVVGGGGTEGGGVVGLETTAAGHEAEKESMTGTKSNTTSVPAAVQV